TADCNDGCPADPLKVEPGICGCGTADTDTDADGTADCNDGCPADPLKVEPGICGCGTADTDTDADGTADCNDGCPADPLKVEPGICGCGTADTDTDADGIADCMDECPGGQGTIGSSCDDGDPETVNDVLDSTCTCHGAPLNDDCFDAIAITVQAANDCPANATAGDNTYATAGVTLPSCAPDGVLSDVWYVFNAGDNTDVTITLEHDTTTSMGVAVYTACDGAELHCAAAPSTPFAFAVSPNSAYLVRVFTALSSGQAGPFTICVSAGINTVVPDVTTTVGTLFPNPNDGRFTVRISGAGRTADLRLLDMAGRVVWSAHERVGPDASLDVDATRLVPGVYTLEVDAAGRKSAHRVVLR
ncbi:MAG TPA: T9SS type A sorting domain-containing protein, partial [Flavobacteriales bacterium]|nr:T9SS type A sorting domain-containing protein [Flavobacteriales bacterium]